MQQLDKALLQKDENGIAGSVLHKDRQLWSFKWMDTNQGRYIE